MKTCNRTAVALLHMTLFRPLSPKILSDSPPLQTSLLFYAFTDSATWPLMSFRLNFGSTWIITQIPHVLRWVFCLHMNMDFGSPQSALYGNTLDLSLPAESTWTPLLVEAHTALHTFFFLCLIVPASWTCYWRLQGRKEGWPWQGLSPILSGMVIENLVKCEKCNKKGWNESQKPDTVLQFSISGTFSNSVEKRML